MSSRFLHTGCVLFLWGMLNSACSAGDLKTRSVRIASVTIDPVYHSLLIPEASGWLGSDAAYSIPTSTTRSVWLFGDTLVGTVKDNKRVKDFDFLHSTIGIQIREATPPGSMEYYWNRNPERNLDFFPHQEGTAGHFYWTTMGMMLGGELFIYCFPISVGTSDWISDTTLIRVSNPEDSPSEWKYQVQDLGLGNSHQGFHSAIYIKEPHVYFLGYDDPEESADRRRMVLARAKAEIILAGGLGEAYEYWCDSSEGGVWKDQPEGLKTLFEPGVTETGIQYIEEWGVFVCSTYTAKTGDIFLTTADEITGPWSEPISIYKVPEHEVSFPIISYAVRPHPELSTQPGEIILTYATNAFGGTGPLFTEEGYEIYWPRFLRVQLEKE